MHGCSIRMLDRTWRFIVTDLTVKWCTINFIYIL